MTGTYEVLRENEKLARRGGRRTGEPGWWPFPLLLGALFAVSGVSYNLGFNAGRELALEECTRPWPVVELLQRLDGLELRAKNLRRREQAWQDLKVLTERRKKKMLLAQSNPKGGTR